MFDQKPKFASPFPWSQAYLRHSERHNGTFRHETSSSTRQGIISLCCEWIRKAKCLAMDRIVKCQVSIVGGWNVAELNPSPEDHNIVLIDSRTIRKAERFIFGCQSCIPRYAHIPFDTVLDNVTGNDPAVTDYILSEPAKCPRCEGPILEKTLVEMAA